MKTCARGSKNGNGADADRVVRSRLGRSESDLRIYRAGSQCGDREPRYASDLRCDPESAEAAVPGPLWPCGEYTGDGSPRAFLSGTSALIAVYEVLQERVVVLNILHGAQKWP